jgi:hypothetical protein
MIYRIRINGTNSNASSDIVVFALCVTSRENLVLWYQQLDIYTVWKAKVKNCKIVLLVLVTSYIHCF